MSDLDLQHLMRLSALRLEGREQALLREDLENIIRMIDDMQSVDTNGVEPMSNPLDMHQRLRPDQVTESVNRDTFLTNAPAAEDGYYLVPRVVE